MNKLATAAISTTIATGVMVGIAPSAQAAPTLRAKALTTANKQKGDPYREYAAGPNAYDCSGLTYYSYKQHGKKLPRTAQGQYNKSTKISAGSRAKGDLVFFGTSSKKIKHVGIYVGGGKILNANSGSYRGRKVVVAPISEYGSGVFYGRIK